MVNLTAIVPVRAGSRRLPNKNLAPFMGTSLLAHKIRQLQKVAAVCRIVVSSDSEEMLRVAADEGVDTHRRAAEYCDETSRTFGEVVAAVCAEVEGEHVLWAPCTSPLIEPETYAAAIARYLREVPEKGDSLISLEETHRFYWDENGPLNYRLGTAQPPSQRLPPLYVWTAGISIAPRLDMVRWQYLCGANPIRFILGKRESVDVDDALDLAAARAWHDMG